MKEYTHEEIKAMVGTEFIYVTPTREELPSMIAAYDPDIGFTCLAVESIGSEGTDFSSYKDKNGEICVWSATREALQKYPDVTNFLLSSIKHLGMIRNGEVINRLYSEQGSSPACEFSK